MAQAVEDITREQHLYRLLAEELRKYASGDRFLTVRSIMDRYKVSQFTAGRSLARLQKEKRIAGRPGSGFFVLDSEPAVERALLVVAIPYWRSPDGELIKSCIGQLAGAKEAWDIRLWEFDPRRPIPRELPEELGEVRAMILLPASGPVDLEELAQLERFSSRMPVIVLGRHFDLPGVAAIGIDNGYAGMLAAHHLARNGHRSIAVLVDEPPNRVIRDRVDGVRNYCLLYGMELEVIDCAIHAGEHSPHRTIEVFQRRLESPVAFTGLVGVGLDGMSGVAHACLNAGFKAADALSLVVIGGEHTSGRLFPPLDTVGEYIDRQLTTAAALLTGEGFDAGATPFIRIDTEVIIRGSVAKRTERG